METLRHYVGGKLVDGTSERFSEVDNPATGELNVRVPLANENEVDSAVATALEAFEGWATTSPLRRARDALPCHRW